MSTQQSSQPESMATSPTRGGRGAKNKQKQSLTDRDGESPAKPVSQRKKITIAETPDKEVQADPAQDEPELSDADLAGTEESGEPRAEQEVFYYLSITQDGDRGSWKPMKREDVLVAYTEAALDADVNDPIGDIGRRGPKGPYQVYIDGEDIDKILATTKSLFVGTGDDKVHCEMKKITFSAIDDNGADIVDDEVPMHLTHYLEEGAQFKFVKESHLKKFWRGLGFKVSRANREKQKLDALGLEGHAGVVETVHLNVLPLEGEISLVDWPSYAEPSVKTHSKNEQPTTFKVRYAMNSHPNFGDDFCLRRCHTAKPCAVCSQPVGREKAITVAKDKSGYRQSAKCKKKIIARSASGLAASGMAASGFDRSMLEQRVKPGSLICRANCLGEPGEVGARTHCEEMAVATMATKAIEVDLASAMAAADTPGRPSTRSREEAEARAQAAAVSASAWALPAACRPAKSQEFAVVTLVSSNEGYPAGALALSAALEVLGSELRRIALVTPSVTAGIRELVRSGAWEVREVPEVPCNQVLGAGVTSARYDLGAEYQQKKAKWLTTCTKLHAWNLLDLTKVLFLDADTLVLRPIDALVEHPSDFAAAPDTFPADQFNSGVMVIKPSKTKFEQLLAWNRVNGTAEGGDQCLLNEFFGEWFYGAWDDQDSGRLPWIMNVAAASHEQFRTLSRMQSRDEPAVVHFVSDGKPWLYMVLKFQGQADRIPPAVRRVYHAWDQMYWLAKTNRICHGALTDDEKRQATALLESV